MGLLQERGRKALAVVAASVASLALLAACGGDDAEPTRVPGSNDPQSDTYTPGPTRDEPASEATTTAEPTPQGEPPSGTLEGLTAQELLDLSAEASRYLTSLRYKSTIGPDSGGNYIESTVEVLPPNRTREIQHLNDQERTLVQVGAQAYMREGQNPWGRVEGVTDFQFPPPETEQGPLYVPVILRYEDLEGRNCAVVSFEQQVSLSEGRFVEYVQWICEDDYLIRRAEVYGVQEGEKDLGAVSENFEYNVPIEPIELPE